MDMKTMIILGMVVIFAFLFAIMVYEGPMALVNNTMSIISILIVVGFLLTVGYIVLKVLTPKPPDIPKEARKEVYESARVSANPFIVNHKLWIKGDEDYQGHPFGTIVGSTRVKYIITDDEDWITNHTSSDDRYQLRIESNHLYEIEETVFFVKEFGAGRALSPPLDVRATGKSWKIVWDEKNKVIYKIPQDGKCHPEFGVFGKDRQANMIQHSPLAGDVFLKCNSLNLIDGIFYPNTIAGSTIPEQTRLASVDRKYGMIVLKIMGDINDKAMDANAAYKMTMDGKGLLDSGATPAPPPTNQGR
jgi:hypothetical protein